MSSDQDNIVRHIEEARTVVIVCMDPDRAGAMADAVASMNGGAEILQVPYQERAIPHLRSREHPLVVLSLDDQEALRVVSEKSCASYVHVSDPKDIAGSGSRLLHDGSVKLYLVIEQLKALERVVLVGPEAAILAREVGPFVNSVVDAARPASVRSFSAGLDHITRRTAVLADYLVASDPGGELAPNAQRVLELARERCGFFAITTGAAVESSQKALSEPNQVPEGDDLARFTVSKVDLLNAIRFDRTITSLERATTIVLIDEPETTRMLARNIRMFDPDANIVEVASYKDLVPVVGTLIEGTPVISALSIQRDRDPTDRVHATTIQSLLGEKVGHFAVITETPKADILISLRENVIPRADFAATLGRARRPRAIGTISGPRPRRART